MKDAASGPAADIVKSVKQVRSGFTNAGKASDVYDSGLSKLSDMQLDVVASSKRLDKAQDDLQKSLKESGSDSKSLSLEQVELLQSVRKAGAEFAASQDKLGKYNKAMADASKKTSAGTYAIQALATGAKAGLAALLALGAATVAAGGALGVGVVHATDFARTTQSSFAAVTGSAEGGAKALANIRDVAAATAMPLEEVRKTYATLTAAGMNPAMATDLSKMRGDWLAMGEEAEAAFGKLTDAMVIGKVEISQFEDIAKNAGGRLALGQALGFTSDMMQETAAGTALLEAKLATLKPDAFLQVVIGMAKAKGELGSVSKNAATFAQRLDSIKEVGLQSFVQEADLTGEGMTRLLDSIEQLTKSQDFKDFARSMGDSLIKVGEALTSVAKFIVENWNIIGPTLKGIGYLLAAVFAAIAVAGFMLIAPLYLITASVIGIISAFSTIISWLSTNWNQIPTIIIGGLTTAKDFILSIAGEAFTWGSDIVQGLIDGISGMIGKAVAKASELASAVANAAKGAFGINSPSKLFDSFGGYLSIGLAKGIDKTSNKAVIAAQNLANGVESGVVDALGIHSPSRVLERLGKFTALGFSKGANDNASPWIPKIGDLPNAGIPDLTANVIPEMQGMDPLSMAAPSIQAPQAISPSAIQVGGGGSTSTSTSTISLGGIHITTAPGESFPADQIEQQLTTILERVSKRHGAKKAA